MLYFNPQMPTGNGDNPQIQIYTPTSKRSASYTFVTAVPLISCGASGFFVGHIVLPDTVTAAMVPYLGISFVSVALSNTTIYADGPSCNPSTPNNYYTSIGSAPVNLVASPNGCDGQVISNFRNYI